MAGKAGSVWNWRLCVAIAVFVMTGLAVPEWKYNVILAILLAVLLIRFRRIIYIIIVTLPRDFTCFKRYFLVVRETSRQKKENATVVSIFTARAAKEPEKTCFIFEDRIWTNRDVNEYSNRVAHVFQNAGLRHGDTVALYMDNRVEYICIWLGLAKLGVVTALINCNLRMQQLLHTLQVAKPKCTIYCKQTASAIHEICATLDSSMKFYHLEHFNGESVDGRRVMSLNPLLDAAPSSAPTIDRQPSFSDKLLYIYTSGTTGLPKAAIIPHSRYLFASSGLIILFDIRPDDVFYDPLPLYHSSGGMLGVGPALIGGIPVVIAKKFSASGYWKDCIKYNCTVGQYIGEICRYLLATPPMPEDSQHRVRIMLGNGIRPAIWGKFVERFKVSRIAELYASTEGNATLISMDEKVGAIGFLPRYMPWSVVDLGLIRVDRETFQPLRNKNGLCIKCDIGEPGMFIGIINSKNVTREFHGYAGDQDASKKKIVSNVFKKGDKAFLSGDILVMDEYGYIYFIDRAGDTFRWKGENVSTAEVEAVIINNIGLRDAIVYGVEVPGHEGRAGMVAIVDVDCSLDIDDLACGLDQMLASYARPFFLRVLTHIDKTGTFKLKKITLQDEGFNPTIVKDKLYFRLGKSYVPLNEELYQSIIAGNVRM